MMRLFYCFSVFTLLLGVLSPAPVLADTPESALPATDTVYAPPVSAAVSSDAGSEARDRQEPAAFAASPAETVESYSPTLLAGLHLQANSAYLPGLHVAAYDSRILDGSPRLTLGWSTSRLADALGSLGLVEDWVTLTPAWYFRPQKTINPYVELELGYARYAPAAPAFDLIDNDSPVITLSGGSEFALLDGRLRLFADLGFSLLSSSIVYPFQFAIGLNVDILGASVNTPAQGSLAHE